MNTDLHRCIRLQRMRSNGQAFKAGTQEVFSHGSTRIFARKCIGKLSTKERRLGQPSTNDGWGIRHSVSVQSVSPFAKGEDRGEGLLSSLITHRTRSDERNITSHRYTALSSAERENKRRREQSTQATQSPLRLALCSLPPCLRESATLPKFRYNSGDASAPPPENQRDYEQHKEHDEQNLRDAR